MTLDQTEANLSPTSADPADPTPLRESKTILGFTSKAPIENVKLQDGLGSLADPAQFQGPLDIAGCEGELLVEQLKTMLIIRMAEEQIADMVVAQKVNCPCHLGIGQEAIAVGVSAHLRTTDRVFGAHRSHSHYLALGADVYSLFAEVLGRSTGCARGMGGSMHLHSASHGFLGSVPLMASTVPIAAGAALAAKMDGADDIAVSYFGDGAVEEGVLQETLNLAAIMHLPIVFVCENNLFASHMHIGLRQPNNSTVRFAQAHCINAALVDGNDVVAVSNVAKQMVDNARKGQGPSYIEAVTYRWRGHVGPSEDIDVGVKRSGELSLWKGRDPIRRLAAALESARLLSSAEFVELQQEVRNLITNSWTYAEQSPYPDQSALLDLVYSSIEPQ